MPTKTYECVAPQENVLAEKGFFRYLAEDGDDELYVSNFNQQKASLEESERNIERLFDNSNYIFSTSNSNIKIIPSILSNEQLEILNSILQDFKITFPKACEKEYKDEFAFLIRVCLNDKELLNLVDKFIDTLQNKQIIESLNRLTLIIKEFLQTRNYCIQSSSKCIENPADQSKLLKDFLVFKDNALNASLPKVSFLVLYLFQIDSKKLARDIAINTSNDKSMSDKWSIAQKNKPKEEDKEKSTYLTMDAYNLYVECKPQSDKSKDDVALHYENSEFLKKTSNSKTASGFSEQTITNVGHFGRSSSRTSLLTNSSADSIQPRRNSCI